MPGDQKSLRVVSPGMVRLMLRRTLSIRRRQDSPELILALNFAIYMFL